MTTPTRTARPAQFRDCYGPTWGRQLARTRPAPGNHDWDTADLAGYLGYFGDGAAPDGDELVLVRSRAWHIVVLDFGLRLGRRLRARVDAGPLAGRRPRGLDRPCTLAIWHHPRFSSGDHGNDASVAPFWTALYDAGADVVVNGHDHDYERFAPQDPGGRADAARGLREFVVGTGGAALRTFPNPAANSERPGRGPSRGDPVHAPRRVVRLDVPPDHGWLGDAGSGACH